MEMIPVSSSNLVAVGYDSVTETLRIQFRSSTYDYFNVPAHIHQGLMNASSKGQYHATYIKNVYQYTRIL